MAQPVANTLLTNRGAVLGEPEAPDQEGQKPAEPQAEPTPEDERQPSLLMQGLLCSISSLEGADTVLLGACMSSLQHDIGLGIKDIGYMNICQGVSANLGAPFWGILADRGILKRRTILLLGAVGQGMVTIMLAFVTSMVPMLLLRCLNGILLAALRPISNGIIADVTAEKHRGKIFGRVQSSLLMGMFVTNMLVVPMAPEQVFGQQGWRVAFVLVGLVSVVVSGLVTLLMVEPPREEAAASQAAEKGAKGCRAVVTEALYLLQFFRMPTFCIMIMQGIFGTIPWTVMGYMTAYFQLTGIDNGYVAILSSIQPITGAFGNIIGGLVADTLAKHRGLHGRPLSAQLTVAMGIPIIYMIFQGIPAGSGSFGIYLTLNIAFGLLGSWAQSGTNFPILSHIVPSSARSRVMAWEGALENSIATAVGPTAVGQLADAFGYTFGQDGQASGKDLVSARALGKAMAATVCIPSLICLIAYSLLHWSYPRDVRRLELQEQCESKEAAEAKAAAAQRSMHPGDEGCQEAEMDASEDAGVSV